MKREEAAKLLEMPVPLKALTQQEFTRFIQAVNMAIKALETEPHWISVTERLPESKEDDFEYPTVLITFENGEILLGCFYESTKEWGTGEYFDEKCFPIAWMPLPESFKGVTE